jgi:stage II sporulation protein GA (sporulation sigma-E factor processing peptidase)
MHFNNSFVYIDFSLTFLLIATIIAYGIICLVRFFMDKTKSANGKYIIVVHHSGRVVSEQGLADSGNILLCPFTGKSVIVFSKTSAGILLGQDINTDTLIISPDNLPKGIRLIPFKTVGNCGVMPVFRPDEVIIQSEYENKSKKVDALIGVGSKDTCAVFNPCLLH